MRRLLLISLLAAIGSMACAPGASAVSFHSPTAPTYLSGEQVEMAKFRFPSTHWGEYFLEPICAVSNTEGVVGALTQEQIQLFPTYLNCTTQGFPGVTIDVNGCSYTVSPVSSGGGFKGNMKLTCPSEQKMVFTFFSGSFAACQIIIPAQTPAESNFQLTNEAAGVRMTGTAKGFSYFTNPSSTLYNCGLAAKDAEFVLDLRIKGYSDAARTKQVTFLVS